MQFNKINLINLKIIKIKMSSKILNFFEIDSTNLEAKRMIDANMISTSVIISAKIQTNGRGRLERTWYSLLGNFMFSIVIPVKWVKNINTLPPAVCIAIYKAIFPNLNIYFKWPNDLIILEEGIPKKIAGILIEKHKDFMIIGIGINVKETPNINAIFPPTNLAINNINIETELEIDNYLLNILRQDSQIILQKWRERNYFQGKFIKINKMEGIFEDIDENFSVILNQNGLKKIITFGDVE